MISSRNRLTLIIATTILGTAACTKAQNQVTIDTPADNIFANRPIAAVPELTVITLSEPPLLKVSKKTKAGWQVPASAKKRLLAEQRQFEANLKRVAPDAKIIYRYHMTLNAVALFTSSDVSAALLGLPGVRAVTPALSLARPQALDVKPASSVSGVNSVNFIGADEAHKKGFTGKGMKVGVLDTGIDYTHSMLGGSGKAEDFKNTDPSKPSTRFPNAKVVGGIDLVGTDFNVASTDSAVHEPKPDGNPLDEGGHGSHVAGTIAGHGDGVTTYDGVAPDADLYAIKVFGKDGSTADAVVIAGFEYAVDPNGDLNPDDQLDVINMSLGGGFGQPHILYTEAIRNLSLAGTVVVASAGNSGPVDYIVGAPSTANDAISVAASIDGSPINWQFRAVKFDIPNTPSMFVKAVEGPISKPIADAGAVTGELVDIGDASEELSDDVKTKVKGKVALIARGKVAFAVKLQRAFDAGAIGAVVYTNDSKAPIAMGGEGKVELPAIMVSQAVGKQLLLAMAAAPVTIEFQTTVKIEEPENIDTITDFSSKGPRSEDNLIKPEIAAPGQQITSAAMGTGHEGTQMNGTSMAGPHMAGAMILLKQAHPDLDAKELKALAMGTAKVLTKGDDLPITLQGAGRIQLGDAISAPLFSESPALSLGRVQIQETKTLYRTMVLRNLTDADISVTTAVKATPGMEISLPASVTVPAKGNVHVTARFTFTIQNPDELSFELDGRIFFKQGTKTLLQVPAMAIRTQASLVGGAATANGVALQNTSPNVGVALAFNLLGQDAKKPLAPASDKWRSRACDLQSAGYRILNKVIKQGQAPVDVIQFAFKVYDPVTMWLTCSPSVLIDTDGDGNADQEIAGVTGGSLEGVEKANGTTVVLDMAKARDIRLAYEKDLSDHKPEPKADYTPAVLAQGPMLPPDNSTVIVIQAPMQVLKAGADGKLHIKLAIQSEGGDTFQPDNFLGRGDSGQWLTISPNINDQGHFGMEEVTEVPATGAVIDMTKGAGQEPLVIYYPFNEFKVDGQDSQQQIF